MMATLRIRLVTGHDVISDAIRAAELGFTYSHAEVEMPDGSGYLGAHAEGGVAMRPLGYDAGPGTLERVFEVEVSNAQAADFYAFLRAQLGKPYDFAGIAGFLAGALLHPDVVRTPGAWREEDCWFCSELVMAGLLKIGVFGGALVETARRITPEILAYVLDAIILYKPAPCERDRPVFAPALAPA